MKRGCLLPHVSFPVFAVCDSAGRYEKSISTIAEVIERATSLGSMATVTIVVSDCSNASERYHLDYKRPGSNQFKSIGAEPFGPESGVLTTEFRRYAKNFGEMAEEGRA